MVWKPSIDVQKPPEIWKPYGHIEPWKIPLSHPIIWWLRVINGDLMMVSDGYCVDNLVGGWALPLWNSWWSVSNSWDDDIPNMMESHKIHVPMKPPTRSSSYSHCCWYYTLLTTINITIFQSPPSSKHINGTLRSSNMASWGPSNWTEREIFRFSSHVCVQKRWAAPIKKVGFWWFL